MNLLTDMFVIWLFGAIPVILSLVFGIYYLRNDRFPWERNRTRNKNTDSDTATEITH